MIIFHFFQDVSVSTIFVLAAILRFITPSKSSIKNPSKRIYKGWLDQSEHSKSSCSSSDDCESAAIIYADGLYYNLVEGWYEFKCDCLVHSSTATEPVLLSDELGNLVKTSSLQPRVFEEVVAAYLTSPSGGNMMDVLSNPSTSSQFGKIVKAVSLLYARMVAGDGALSILQEMKDKSGIYEKYGLDTPCQAIIDDIYNNNNSNVSSQSLHHRPSPIPSHSKLVDRKLTKDRNEILSVVLAEVASVEAIDLHTHLLPPSHGSLCLWGIDELLTYHYLVAEYFMTAPPSISPTAFYALSKHDQADLIWKALFIDRSPLSEACRGVITTLEALGLSDALHDRDLEAIRVFYRSFRDDGEAGATRFSDLIFQLSGVKFNIMTNIPFDINEAQYWRPKKKVGHHHLV